VSRLARIWIVCAVVGFALMAAAAGLIAWGLDLASP
jgi:hypothetical protein